VRKVEIEATKRILDDFFKVDEARLRFERFDGSMSPLVRRLCFERGDSVAALIFNPRSGLITLVNQFKFPTHAKGPGWITETVAGMIDKNESAEDAVRREVLEETGYKVSNMEHISTFYVSPGGSSERIILYYAEVGDQEKIQTGGGVVSENEDIALVELSLSEAVERLKNGHIADAKTIIGIMWLAERLKERLGGTT
jgi:nudix-type nucleoside diphosphatase (YffH/AdpP family)